MACHRFPQSLITFMFWSLQKMKATLYLHHFSTSSERVRHLGVTKTILGNRKNERWKELAFDLCQDVSRTKKNMGQRQGKTEKGVPKTRKNCCDLFVIFVNSHESHSKGLVQWIYWVQRMKWSMNILLDYKVIGFSFSITQRAQNNPEQTTG